MKYTLNIEDLEEDYIKHGDLIIFKIDHEKLGIKFQ